MYAYRGMRAYLQEVAPDDEALAGRFVLSAERLTALRDLDRALSNVASIRADRQRTIDDPDGIRREVAAQRTIAANAVSVLRASLQAAEEAFEDMEDGISAAEERIASGLGIVAGEEFSLSAGPAPPPAARFVPVPDVPVRGSEADRRQVIRPAGA